MSVAQKIAELQEAFKKEYGLGIDLLVHVHSHRNFTHFNMADKTLRDISKKLPGEVKYHSVSDSYGDTHWHRLLAKDVNICIFYKAE